MKKLSSFIQKGLLDCNAEFNKDKTEIVLTDNLSSLELSSEENKKTVRIPDKAILNRGKGSLRIRVGPWGYMGRDNSALDVKSCQYKYTGYAAFSDLHASSSTL